MSLRVSLDEMHLRHAAVRVGVPSPGRRCCTSGVAVWRYGSRIGGSS
jgi:hypothetical protein